MSRGAQQTTRNLTDQQLAQQNQMISQEGQSDAQDRSLRRPDRATRQGAGADRRITSAAESSHVREPAIERAARRPERPGPDLRRGH